MMAKQLTPQQFRDLQNQSLANITANKQEIKPVSGDFKPVRELSFYEKLDRKAGGFLPFGLSRQEAKKFNSGQVRERTDVEADFLQRNEGLTPQIARQKAEFEQQKERVEKGQGNLYDRLNVGSTKAVQTGAKAVSDFAKAEHEKVKQEVRDINAGKTTAFELDKKFAAEVPKGIASSLSAIGLGAGEGISKALKSGAEAVGWEQGTKFFNRVDQDFDTLQDVVLNEKYLKQDEDVAFSGLPRLTGEFLLPYGASEAYVSRIFTKVAPKLVSKYPRVAAMLADSTSAIPISGAYSLSKNVSSEQAKEELLWDIGGSVLAIGGAREMQKNALQFADKSTKDFIFGDFVNSIGNTEILEKIAPQINNLKFNTKKSAQQSVEKLKQVLDEVKKYEVSVNMNKLGTLGGNIDIKKIEPEINDSLADIVSNKENFRNRITQEISDTPNQQLRTLEEAQIIDQNRQDLKKTDPEQLERIQTRIDDDVSQIDDRRILEQMQDSRSAVGSISSTGDLSLRNLKQEAEELIKRQSEKIPDDAIRKQRNDLLLGEESLQDVIIRKRGIITDAEALERAKQLKVSLDDVLNLPKGTTLNKEQITAVRQVLSNEREVNKILKDLVDSGATLDRETRQYVNRFRNIDGLGDLTDEEMVLLAYQESTKKLKQLEIVNLAIGSEAGRSLQALKQNVPAVDRRMRAIWNRIKRLPKEKQIEMTELLSKVNIDDPKEYLKFLDSLSKPSVWEKIAEFSTAAKLWSPTTHMVNFFGNTLRQAIDLGVKGITSPKTAKADIAGSIAGFKVGFKNFMKAMTDEGYAQQLSKFVEESGRTTAIKGKFGEAVRLPFRALGASDEIFSSIAYNRSLYRDASKSSDMKSFLKNPPLEAVEKATKEAQRMTFQEPMDELTRKINQFRDPANFDSQIGKAGATVTRAFIPFLKTPTNIFKQSFDFSPLSFVKNYKEIASGSELGRTLAAEAVIGSTVAAYFVSLAQDGLVTGAAPANKKKRDTFYLDKQPYSVKIGDDWYAYNRVDPIATTFGLAVDVANKYSEEGAASMVSSVIDNLKDKTYLQGIKDLSDLFAGEDWERKKAIQNAIIGSSIPSIFGATARATDQTIRDTKGGIINRAKSQIPFLSESLPARVDVLGDEIKRGQSGLNALFNPIRKKGASQDNEREKIVKEFNENGYMVSLPYPNRKFSYKGSDYAMSGEEYEVFSKTFGKNFKNELTKAIDSKKYKTINTEDKIELFDRIKSRSAKIAKDEFMKNQPNSYKNKFKALSVQEKRKIINNLVRQGFTKQEISEKLR